MKKNIIKIALDTIPVIFGILIALFISGLKETSDNERYLSRVFSSIEQEMKDNADGLESVIPKHYALMDTVTYYIEDESLTLTDLIVKSKGFQVKTIQNTSWRSLLNAKIELVEYDMIAQLSGIEASRSIMQMKLDKLMDYLYEHIDSVETKRKRLLIIHLLNLIETEESLLKLHEDYLE